MKICPVAVELFHAVRQRDGQTDKAKLIVAFRNTANASKNDDHVRGRVERFAVNLGGREDGDNVDDDGYTSIWSEGRGQTALACY